MKAESRKIKAERIEGIIYQCPECGYDDVFSEFTDPCADGFCRCPYCQAEARKKGEQVLEVKSIMKVRQPREGIYRCEVHHDRGGGHNYYGTSIEAPLTNRDIKMIFNRDYREIVKNVNGVVNIRYFIEMFGETHEYDLDKGVLV